jgi:Zn-dependent membrane protease YugP
LSGYILVMIVGIAVSGVAALWVQSSYSKYSKKMSASGLTGAQTARVILDRNNLTNVRVEPVAGQLTDHYDPRVKVVRLSLRTTSASPPSLR